MKIYLSGDMYSGWQDSFKKIEGHLYLDPRDHGLLMPEDYVKRDLEMVTECDLVLAYLGEFNPSGIGLAVELGYAKALGKPIWLVCDKKEAKWDFIRHLANKTESTLAGLERRLRAVGAKP